MGFTGDVTRCISVSRLRKMANYLDWPEQASCREKDDGRKNNLTLSGASEATFVEMARDFTKPTHLQSLLAELASLARIELDDSARENQ